MSSATDQIFINAAGNIIGGPAAGYAAVQLFKFASPSYHRDRGEDYMSDMLKYMADIEDYLSVVELEELNYMKKKYVRHALYGSRPVLILIVGPPWQKRDRRIVPHYRSLLAGSLPANSINMPKSGNLRPG